MMRQVSKCAQPGGRVERPYRESGAKSEGMNVGLEPGTFPHVYRNQFHLTWCGATYSCVGPYCRIFVRPSTQYPASIPLNRCDRGVAMEKEHQGRWEVPSDG